MTRTYAFFIILAACAAIALSGCGTMSMPLRRDAESGEPVRIERQLGVSTNLRFDDVPTPDGFNIIRDQSFIFQDASTRVGLLRYSGRATVTQIVAFYKTQMALYNWDLMNMLEHANITMNFTKGDENCIVTLEPLATKTLLNIVLAPKKGTLSTGLGAGPKGKF